VADPGTGRRGSEVVDLGAMPPARVQGGAKPLLGCEDEDEPP